jgi:nucleoside-diphosphate-sugar epimerase
MSDIVIIGATGVIGWRSVCRLVDEGHHVTGVTRAHRGAPAPRIAGRPRRVRQRVRACGPARAVGRADAVVNLLTHIPPARRMGEPVAWAENDRLRREASAVISTAGS